MTRDKYKMLKEIADENWRKMEKASFDQDLAKGLVTFSHEGFAIFDPFFDESLRYEVDPIEYYGEKVWGMLKTPGKDD